MSKSIMAFLDTAMVKMEHLGITSSAGASFELSPPLRSFCGILLGATSVPLFLIAIYFYKANPKFFTREHTLSILALFGAFTLIALATAISNLGISISSLQIAPAVNQIFVGSFALSTYTIVATSLSLLSLYFAMVGYTPIGLRTEMPGLLMFALLVIALVVAARLLNAAKYCREKFGEIHLSDIAFTIMYTSESAFCGVSTMGLLYWAVYFHPLVYLAACPLFLVPIESALYYYPATFVIPMFTAVARLWGATLVGVMFENGLNVPAFLSIFSGLLGAFFPLILSI